MKSNYIYFTVFDLEAKAAEIFKYILAFSERNIVWDVRPITKFYENISHENCSTTCHTKVVFCNAF